MKKLTKLSWLLFKKHYIRFITIMAIVVVSVGFMAGVGEIEGKIKFAVNEEYIANNVYDIHLKSKSPFGFSSNELDWLTFKYGENTLSSFSYEIKNDDVITRIQSYDLQKNQINKTTLESGRLPLLPNELAVDATVERSKDFSVGNKVTLNGVEYTITGVLNNTEYISNEKEPSLQFENEIVSYVFYSNTSVLPMTTDVYITLQDRTTFDGRFGKNYRALIDNAKSEIETVLGENNVKVLSLFESYGYYSVVQYAEKVGIICIVFVIFFLLVTLLVVYSTMSRLLAEERAQIACQKTLGYGDGQILFKYALFVFVATLLGSLVSFPVGFGLTYIVYTAFGMKYNMPAFPQTVEFFYFLVVMLAVVITTLVLTCLTGRFMIKEKPSTLLAPKIQKAGRKTVIEKIGFIWNRLSFKYKSTARNILLFKSRFFMTVFSIMGSCVLVFCGIGLLNCTMGSEGVEMIKAISAALLAFSAGLSALVIYNLTNINVSERTREIATLMVLGYNNKEVTTYIFREIYVMSAIGAIIGVPIGVVFIEFVFSLISFGTLSQIAWWTYLVTPCVTMLFSFLSTLLLKRRIENTDMNASLKSIE